MVVLGDQLTKYLIEATLRLGEVRPVIPGFMNLTLVLNPGAAFGLLAEMGASFRGAFFITVSVGAIAFILGYRWRCPQMGRLPALGLSLILGGAIGNLVDRLRIGLVIDFLDFYYRAYHWPAFNVADSAISIGVGLMLLEILVERRGE